MQSTRKRRAKFLSYEFDFTSGELTRSGTRLRLETQPAELLKVLIEANGSLVSRDDLITALWHGETEGEFDRRLDKAVAKLRASLNDDPTKPRFIETLKGRGYRFIADVEIVNGNGSSIGKSLQGQAESAHNGLRHESGNSLARAEASESEPSKEVVARPIRSEPLVARLMFNRRQWGLAAGLILTAILISAWAIHRSSVLSATHRSIAVLSFTNLNGNPADQWLSTAITDWLTSDLTGDGNLRAIPRDEIARFRFEHQLTDPGQSDPNLLFNMGHDLGADLLLSGSYANSGDEFESRMRLDVDVRDSRSRKLLFSVSATGSREETFDLVSSVGMQLRRKLKLAPMDTSGLSSLRAMLPTNPDAARFYAEGTEEIDRSDPADARVLLQRAIALEPEHPLSHAALSTADTMLGFSADARTEAKTALDLAGRLPTEQRLLVQGQFYEANYDWDKAVDVYSRLFQFFPGSAENGLRLAHAQALAGRPLVALDTIAQMRQAVVVASDAEARMDLAEAEIAGYISDFHRQKDAADRAVEKARASHATQLLARAEEEEGEALRRLGDFPEALALWKDAQTRYTAIGDQSGVARLLIDQGRVLWQQGNPEGAKTSYRKAVSLSHQTGDEASLGRALTALAQYSMYYVGPAEGNRLCRQAQEIFEKTGNKQEEAYTLSLMADILSTTHRQQAVLLYERSLQLSREVNDRSRIAGRLMDLGIQATVEGNLAVADQDLQQSLAIYRQIGERNREALQLNGLSIVRTWQGRLDEANNLSNRAVSMLDSIGDAVPTAQSRQVLARVQLEQGQLPEAEATLRQTIQEYRDAHNPGGIALASLELAEVFLRERKVKETKAAFVEYDRVFKDPSRRLIGGEHVPDRMILAALADAADGKAQRARTEAAAAVNYALKAGQGSMVMKGRLVLGEVELESGKQSEGHHHLKSLIADADQQGFGLISHQARELLTR